MSANLFTGQPSWLVLLCLLLAAGYAVSLYFRDKKNEFSTVLKAFLGIIRFIAVFLVSFLLLAPFVRSISHEKEKPVIILALDNSQSMLLSADSAKYKSTLPEDLDRLAEKLGRAGEVRKYLFGNNLQQLKAGENFANAVTYHDQETDFSGMISGLSDLYTNLNVGALIIASDGIYNTGTNPLYQAKEWPHPIYTIALGDTSMRTDLILARVNFNRMVYLNNEFPLEIVVRAGEAEGMKSRLRVYHGDQLLHSEDFTIDKDDYTHSFRVLLDAKQSGMQKYSVVLDPLKGELSKANNRKDIYVDVLDSKSKVLILYGSPHPDISALNEAISSNMNYEVHESLLKDFNGDITKYSMVILHQLPSVDEPAQALMKTIAEKKIPVLYVLGTKSDLVRFDQMKAGVHIVTTRRDFDEAVPVLNPNFTAFSLSETAQSWLYDLPPLIVPLGDYQVANSARVLLNQRLGSIETTRPLILLNETLDGRDGVICGEGIWKWRIYDYARSKSHQSFNELIDKIVQYLSLKEQKKQFRVYNQSSFRETEPVTFDAEVYNESYELTSEPEVEITIQNEDGKQFPFVFNKTGNSYHLNAGMFPPGNYSYQATAKQGNTIFSAKGQFSVSAIDLEALNSVADHHLLYQLAEEGGGQMYGMAGLDRLGDDILSRGDIKPVIYSQKKYEDLLDKWWLLAVIAGLLTMEWFLRKRAGSY